MPDLAAALKRSTEAYRKLVAVEPREAAAQATDDTLTALPKSLTPPEDALQSPAALTIAADDSTPPPAPPVHFTSTEAPPPFAPAADPAATWENDLRHRLRRYPSIRRKEELL